MNVEKHLLVFIILTIVLLFFSKEQKWPICISIIISLIVLYLYKNKSLEKFIVKSESINKNENIKQIGDNLSIYLTVFNVLSYNPSTPTIWNNIAPMRINDSCGGPSTFKFDTQPILDDKKGINIFNNRLVFPFANSINITFNGQYSIVFSCLHNNSNKIDNEIEIIKFYANSPNNNGIRLYINQSKDLMFEYANLPAVKCSNHILSNNELNLYYIIKSIENIRVLWSANSTDNKIIQIANISITSVSRDISFSNKEIILNQYKNWNAFLVSIAIYTKQLEDIETNTIYKHTQNEFVKYNNPIVNDILKQINDIKKCPYNEITCNICKGVSDWNNLDSIISSDQRCLLSINDYCTMNPKDPQCTCWDVKSSKYSSYVCKLYRNMFNKSEDICETKPPPPPSVKPIINNPTRWVFKDIQSTSKLLTDKTEKTTLVNYMKNSVHIKNNEIQPLSDIIPKTSNSNIKI